MGNLSMEDTKNSTQQVISHNRAEVEFAWEVCTVHHLSLLRKEKGCFRVLFRTVIKTWGFPQNTPVKSWSVCPGPYCICASLGSWRCLTSAAESQSSYCGGGQKTFIPRLCLKTASQKYCLGSVSVQKSYNSWPGRVSSRSPRLNSPVRKPELNFNLNVRLYRRKFYCVNFELKLVKEHNYS